MKGRKNKQSANSYFIIKIIIAIMIIIIATHFPIHYFTTACEWSLEVI